MDEKRKGLFKRLPQALWKLLARRGPQLDDSSEDDDSYALVGAPIRPRPHLNSGAVALELPDDQEY
ncbi:MAG: hypothetical protein ABSF28_11035 [Terracidiphilus sp.]|jgi:hypothetical protein